MISKYYMGNPERWQSDVEHHQDLSVSSNSTHQECVYESASCTHKYRCERLMLAGKIKRIRFPRQSATSEIIHEEKNNFNTIR